MAGSGLVPLKKRLSGLGLATLELGPDVVQMVSQADEQNEEENGVGTE